MLDAFPFAGLYSIGYAEEKAMKTGAMLLALAMLSLGAPMAMAGEAPSLDDLKFKARPKVSCSFEETPLSEVITFFRQTYKLNIVTDSSADEKDEQPVSLKLKDVPAERALTLALAQSGLVLARDGNIIYIAKPARIALYQRLTRKSYDVTDVAYNLAALDADLGGNGDDDDDDDDDDSGKSSMRKRTREVQQLIVLFTGPENWDYVGTVGGSSSSKNGNTRK